MTTVGTLNQDSSSFGEPTGACDKHRLYAFSVARGGRPQVFEFDISPEGLAALATLVRSEDVLKVVKGVEARFTVESVVSLVAGDLDLVDKLPLRMSELHEPT